ncbi:MAG TPA: phosphatidylinositol mannoside acyltransferase [Acidimicrobiales bacterium]|nr:phosphatidylinositol mannoside acyltransferase [Acidimicrobiales bacterium]
MRPRTAFLLYRGSADVIRALPGPVAGALADAVGGLGALSPRRRAVVTENLRRVLGPTARPSTLRRTVRRAFRAYGRYWVDAARLRSDATRLLAGFEYEGAEILEKAAGERRGVILALPHVGCWEVGGAWCARNGFPLTTVAEPASSRELFDWFVAEREAIGLRVLLLDRAAAPELLATLRRGQVVALLADRDVAGDGVEVEFFGSTTRVPGGPALLALRTGALLVPTAIYHGPGGRHHAVLRPPLEVARRASLREDVARLTQELTRELEVLIARRPEQWHVFQPNWPGDPPAA